MYLVGREFAGSERGAEPLGAVPPFDLVVIDEAHEIFAGLHKRYDRDGIYDETSDEALMAHRVRGFLRSAPVLLLTATPMQNSLAELWGLVQYVEPTGTLLGDITTFREVFCADDDRTLVPGQEHELQRRLGDGPPADAAPSGAGVPRPAVHAAPLPALRVRDERRRAVALRRRDRVPARSRRCTPSPGRQRRLLLIGFHRRMASSIPALAASLENVAARLRRLEAGQRVGRRMRSSAPRPRGRRRRSRKPARTPPVPVDREAVAAELARVEDFVARARSLPHDAKARSFQDAIRVILDLGRDGRGSGKAVVFTESITTQEYLRRLLLDIGLERRGHHAVPRRQRSRPRAAGARPLASRRKGATFRREPGRRREVAVRLALVHEFRTRSKVLVCTEAGAKGLNLQFCETVINYDLPWNPQRIEQRIGRCHRYSQQRDVTVVNFIARDNEAHRLTFEILSQKLDLFGKVLDASDIVLHEPRTDAPEIVVSALSLEFENDLRNIYSRSRTLDEVTREIAALRDKIAERRDAYEKEYERTSQIIESRFDEDVRKVFRRLREELPAGTRRSSIGTSPTSWTATFASRGVEYRRSEQAGRVVFDVAPDAELPAEIGDGRRFATGDARGLDRRAAVESRASAGPAPRSRTPAPGRAARSSCCSRATRRQSCVRWRERLASSRLRWSTTPVSSRFNGWSQAAVVDGDADRSVAGRSDRCGCRRLTAEPFERHRGPAVAR